MNMATRISVFFIVALMFWLPVGASSDTGGPQIIQGAMDLVQGKTHAPLWAPASLPSLANANYKYYAANVEHSRAAYKVSLFKCDHHWPINEVDVSCGGGPNLFGNYGAYVYPSTGDADRAFFRLMAEDCYWWTEVYAPRPVDLGNGVAGLVWGRHVPILRWQYHGWRFAICWEGDDESSSGAIAAAKDLMSMVDRYPLPFKAGYMIESEGADNRNTQAAWVDDRTLIRTWGMFPDYGVPLTSAMRKWPAAH
jgi:hypothetical protein